MVFSIRRRPPPLPNGHNFQTFFTPLFFFCNWLLHRLNGFYTWSQSKISLLSPLVIGSKLRFWGCCDRWLPYNSHVHSHLNYYIYNIHNIKPKLSAKHVFTVREWFWMDFHGTRNILNFHFDWIISLREGCGKSKWKFKMAFAMKGGGVSKGSRMPHTYFEK